jgi:hypothetical protein
MYNRLNKLAMEVVKISTACRRQYLAAEIYSYLPVDNRVGFLQFEAQVRVVKTLLTLRQTHSQKLKDSLEKLIKETGHVSRALGESP